MDRGTVADNALTGVQFNGKWVSWAHTLVAYSAFIGALIVGCWLHYHKIVQNEHYGYPDEWFPSVSATIGDRYPERSVFMVFIAITSGPRFALVALWYFMTARPNSSLPKFLAGIGLFRTFMCGGWTYVTSTDDHDWHDIFMISYLVATLPWTLCCLALSPPNPRAIKYRKFFASLFFGTLVPLIYFFIQHKVHRVAGGESAILGVCVTKTSSRAQRILPTRSLSGLSSSSTSHLMQSPRLISATSTSWSET